MTKKLSTFSTFDMGLATTLITLKYELVKLDKTNPKKIRFVFKEEETIEQNPEIKKTAKEIDKDLGL